MSNRPIKENAFDAAPGGTTGTVTSQPGAWAATPSSPDVSQNPAHFQKSDRNKAKNQPQQSLNKDLDALYSKRQTPTPDEIITGIKYEMGQQIKKDKAEAKRSVLTNLKKDPKFYSNLKQLNITDKDMVDNMTENRHPNDAPAKPSVKPNIEETKKIFAEMAQGYGKKYVVNSQICDVMKEMWAAKNARNSWRTQK
jgi:hypothetical protein